MAWATWGERPVPYRTDRPTLPGPAPEGMTLAEIRAEMACLDEWLAVCQYCEWTRERGPFVERYKALRACLDTVTTALETWYAVRVRGATSEIRPE